MPSYRRALLLSALTLAACSKDPPMPEPAKEAATAVTTAAPAATTAAPAASAAPAAPVSAASATASAAAPTSAEPSPQEWESAKLDVNVVKNWNRPGCMSRRIREWIRVACSEMTTQQGKRSATLRSSRRPWIARPR
jgi:hypothetical protein